MYFLEHNYQKFCQLSPLREMWGEKPTTKYRYTFSLLWDRWIESGIKNRSVCRKESVKTHTSAHLLTSGLYWQGCRHLATKGTGGKRVSHLKRLTFQCVTSVRNIGIAWREKMYLGIVKDLLGVINIHVSIFFWGFRAVSFSGWVRDDTLSDISLTVLVDCRRLHRVSVCHSVKWI